MHIGLRGMKLTRGKTAVGQKKGTSMPMSAAFDEMLEDEAGLRHSATLNYDASRSHLNIYHLPDGVETGQDLTAWVEQQFDKRNAQRMTETEVCCITKGADAGKVYERKRQPMSPRTNPALTFVLTPAADDVRGMSRDEQVRLAEDMVEALAYAMGHEICAHAIHFDEGVPDEDNRFGFHVHAVMLTTDEAGDFGSTRLWNRTSMEVMHRDFVQAMTDFGYEVAPHLSQDEHDRRGEFSSPGRSANAYKREQHIDKLTRKLEHDVGSIEIIRGRAEAEAEQYKAEQKQVADSAIAEYKDERKKSVDVAIDEYKGKRKKSVDSSLASYESERKRDIDQDARGIREQARAQALAEVQPDINQAIDEADELRRQAYDVLNKVNKISDFLEYRLKKYHDASGKLRNLAYAVENDEVLDAKLRQYGVELGNADRAVSALDTKRPAEAASDAQKVVDDFRLAERLRQQRESEAGYDFDF